MTVKEAYDLGLLKVGIKVRTNGDSGSTVQEPFVGKIHSTYARDFYVCREDLNYFNWTIHNNNNRAFIEFLDLAKFSIITKQKITNSIYRVSIDAKIYYCKFLNNNISIDKKLIIEGILVKDNLIYCVSIKE